MPPGVILFEGVAVVADAALARYGRAFLSALNGGALVLSVTEAAELADT